MTIRNPHSQDGTFSAAEKLAALEREVVRSKGYHRGLVDAGRMKPDNFAAKIGALEAIVEDLRAQMVAEAAQACQWQETGDSTFVSKCSTCGATYSFRTDPRPDCPRGLNSTV